MRRPLVLLIALAAVFVVAGIIVTMVVKNRVEQDKLYSLNNLLELNHFATGYVPPDTTWNLATVERTAVPAGTVVRPEWKPDERLSWVADALPYLNQKRQPLKDLTARLDKTKPWAFEANQAAAAIVVHCLVPPTVKLEPAGGPAPTYYLGIA